MLTARFNSIDGGGYGQNICAGIPGAQIGVMITDMWYYGEVNNYPAYGQATPDFSNFGKWGHFSQVVWNSTTEVGCYTSDCTATGLGNTVGVTPFFTVCNYKTQGTFSLGLLSSFANLLLRRQF